MKKIFIVISLFFLAIFLLFAAYLFWGSTEPAEKITWGVNFSQKQAESLDLDWQDVFISLLEDLGVRNLKIAAHWDLLEKEKGYYSFDDLDWQIEEAKLRGAKVLLAIGMKTPRWPECHIPAWGKDLRKEEQQESIMKLLEVIVLRYRGSKTIWAWQVENEPFFPFGECPWRDTKFLKKEINLVKSLDPQRPVVISDSGEFSFWIAAARLGDMVSSTLHREVWFKELKAYFTYPLRPVFYWRKAQIIKKLFNKEVIIGELQTEPWCPNFLLSACPFREQEEKMNLARFQKNIQFGRETGLKEFYLWGAEWWYWMKEKQNKPEIWDEAKRLFQ